MAPQVLYKPPGQLGRYIHKKHVIPPQACTMPWPDDGNIILITNDKAFKFHKHALISQSKKFAERIEIMNDGNTDVVENCPVLEVPFASSFDLGHFLGALDDLHTKTPPPSLPLATLDDFRALQGVLRVSTLSETPALRTRAIAALQTRYPTTLAAWDRVRPATPISPTWEWDRALIINIAREVGAFSILPAAMAMLTNDCSAGEVFGVPLPSSPPPSTPSTPLSPASPLSLSPFSPLSSTPPPPPQQRTPLNPDDAPSFALLKEHNHLSLVSLLLTIRSLGSACTRPPDIIPPKAGLAPAGARILLPGPSQCSSFFKDTAARLLEVQVLENPVGYAQFIWNVLAVKQDKQRSCRYCWREFGQRCEEARRRWWEALPKVLGFEGWSDESLKSVEVDI